MKHFFGIAIAAASLTLTFPASAAAEGEWWEMTTTVEMAGMPAMPTDKPVRFCRVKGDEAKPVQSKEEKNCTVSNVKNVGNTMTFNMKCTGKDAMTGTGELTSTPTSFNQKIKMRSGGEDMAMVSSGKRIGGACKAGA